MLDSIIKKLTEEHKLNKSQCIYLLENLGDEELFCMLKQEAYSLCRKYYGDKIYARGLIEFTNYCRNNCLYCGIRRDNRNINRYRLSVEDIMNCCEDGYKLGYRTFVLQGGEDLYFDDDKMVDIISRIKGLYPECAVTLSIGERSRESYRRMKEAGADRYLLRHESANDVHYGTLHPDEMKLANRKKCLYDLKELGYQLGAGMMVGSPGQTIECLADDLVFLQELKPHMVGIGPFIPHCDTCFAGEKAGSVELTLKLLAIVRLLLPKVLLPATTALGTLDDKGREKGIMCGCNVVMPNLSPISHRRDYALYDNKLSTGMESAQSLEMISEKISELGLQLVTARGDSLM